MTGRLDPAYKLREAHAHFAGWTYDTRTPAVPSWWPGIPRAVPTVTRGAHKATDCCTYTAWMMLTAFPELRVDGAWADLCIWDGSKRWSPLDRVVAEGLGVWATDLGEPGAYLVQSWHRDGTGHARIAIRVPSGLEVYDASKRGGGVRCRLLPADVWRTWGETRAVRLR